MNNIFQSSGFMFTGLYCQEDSPIGKHELCIKWRNFIDYVRIEVVAGNPTSIVYNLFTTEQVSLLKQILF